MDYEMELRSNMNRAILIVSGKELDHERLKLANEKMEEVLFILRNGVPEKASA